jgi:hypothetical protein
LISLENKAEPEVSEHIKIGNVGYIIEQRSGVDYVPLKQQTIQNYTFLYSGP